MTKSTVVTSDEKHPIKTTEQEPRVRTGDALAPWAKAPKARTGDALMPW